MRLHILAATLLVAAAPAMAQTPAPVGVPECDNFLTAYDQCLGSVPAGSREQFAASVTQMRDAWRQAAQNAQARPALAAQCTQVRQQMAQSMAAYNCRF